MMEKAYLFVSKHGERIYPVRFDNRNQWSVVDNFADATFFSNINDALKKQKYAPNFDIAEVSLSIKFINFKANKKD